MKTVGVGIDIVEMERVRNIRFPLRFAEYFLTAAELEVFKKSADPVAFLASRFAAKEATIKAFPGFLAPHDFEVVKSDKKPEIRFSSPALRNRYAAFVSLSHSTSYAAGYAMMMENEASYGKPTGDSPKME